MYWKCQKINENEINEKLPLNGGGFYTQHQMDSWHNLSELICHLRMSFALLYHVLKLSAAILSLVKLRPFPLFPLFLLTD